MIPSSSSLPAAPASIPARASNPRTRRIRAWAVVVGVACASFATAFPVARSADQAAGNDATAASMPWQDWRAELLRACAPAADGAAEAAVDPVNSLRVAAREILGCASGSAGVGVARR